MLLITVVNCGEPLRRIHSSWTLIVPVYGAVVEYKCNIGYDFSRGVREKSSICQHNGNWTDITDCKCKCNTVLLASAILLMCIYYTDAHVHWKIKGYVLNILICTYQCSFSSVVLHL